jgi:hypothetical protein
MDGEDPLDLLARWLAEGRETRDLARQVIVRETQSAYGTRTVVDIDHLLACPLERHEGWRVSTRPTFLPRLHFSSQATHYLKTAAVTRGRTLYCYEPPAGGVVAALSYHLDERKHLPVLLTTIGLRIDYPTNPFLEYRTLAGALVLKHYVHTLATKVGRGGHVDLELADRKDEPLMRRLGFRPAPRLRGRGAGGSLLRQPAPGATGQGPGASR